MAGKSPFLLKACCTESHILVSQDPYFKLQGVRISVETITLTHLKQADKQPILCVTEYLMRVIYNSSEKTEVK